MKPTHALAAALLLITGTAFAETRCEKDAKYIQEVIAANPKLPEAQLKEAKSQLSKGEQFCREKKWAQARDAFAAARDALGSAVRY
jgi:hypothetical protein